MSATLTVAALYALAAQCAPNVHPQTMSALVQTESARHPYSLNVNHDGRSVMSRQYETREMAEAALADLLRRGVTNVDIGAGQINWRAGHLQRRGLPASAALDPCISLRVGGEVLQHCYDTAPGATEHDRLLAALGCYNGGVHDPRRPYVMRVQASADRVVVPALRAVSAEEASLIARQQQAARDARGFAASVPPEPCAPEWDVWAAFECSRRAAPPATAEAPAADPTDGDEAAPVVLRSLPRDIR
jgi:type IV secretion system protein VirB1